METLNEINKISPDVPDEDEFAWADKSMVGCYVGVFFRKSLLSRIDSSSFEYCKVKDGVFGQTGNKGAVCVRFEIDLQSIMIINCHLLSGRRL